VRLRPTSAERRFVRECAARSAGERRVEVCPSTRVLLEGDKTPQMNVALLTSDPSFEDTDLHDNALRWSDFARGFELTEDGRAVLDFWVYSLGRDAELKTNVTAYYEAGRLVRVEGTGDGEAWKF
jgi:hypothetical protein